MDSAAAQVTIGTRTSLVFEVLAIDTAESLGSGAVPVLGTPRLLAWLEAATVAAVEPLLAGGQTSVGVRVELEHLSPSPLGVHVTALASVVEVDGRRLTFEVSARHADGTLVGRGRIARAVVDRDRFLAGIGL